MAIPFLNHLDLQSVSQLQNAILHRTTSASASDVEGKIIYDTGSDTIKYYNGSAWIELGGDTVRTVGVDTDGDGDVDNTLLSSEDLVLKKGSNITLTEADGVVTISSTDTNTTYTAGDGLTLSGTEFSANVAATGTTIAPQTISTNADRLYQVETDDDDNLVVNVPWVDTNTNTDTKQSVSFPTSNADSDFYITFVENSSGAQVGFVDDGFTWNPQTNTLTVNNIIVSGTSTTVNTETISLADNIITLNSNEEGTPSQDAGIEVERGTAANVSLNWNESDDDWEFQAYNHAATPVLTTYKIPRTYSTTIGDGTAQSFTVTHNLGTKLIIVQLYDTSSDATVYADVVRTDTNTITITTGTVPALAGITVLISTAGA